MKKQPKPSAAEIIETLHAAREACIRYEKKYNILTEEFYDLYSQGLLDDDDLNFDFVDWAGSHKTALECQRELHKCFKQSTPAEKVAKLKSHAVVA